MPKHTEPRVSDIRLPRRQFLRQAGMLCGAAGALAAMPGFAGIPQGMRCLSFVHTHTAEKLTTCFFDGSGYNTASLRDVEHLLRDFRTGESHRIDPLLLDILYELQALTGHDAPFEVISGYRSPATNTMLHRKSSGVAEHSQHLLGKAIDVRLSGYSTRRLGEYARSLARGGVGFYAASDFVHLDTGRVRFW
jgi:uncharacterized protein YcbK (DUF882 family)